MGKLYCRIIEISWLRYNLTFNLFQRGLMMAISLDPEQALPFEECLLFQVIQLEPVASDLSIVKRRSIVVLRLPFGIPGRVPGVWGGMSPVRPRIEDYEVQKGYAQGRL